MMRYGFFAYRLYSICLAVMLLFLVHTGDAILSDTSNTEREFLIFMKLKSMSVQ